VPLKICLFNKNKLCHFTKEKEKEKEKRKRKGKKKKQTNKPNKRLIKIR
jgi:hypothetical protein